MLEECINIFIYLQHPKRKQRAGEFPGRALHFFGCLAVKPSLLTRQRFFPGSFFTFIPAEAQPPAKPADKNLCVHWQNLGLRAYQDIKEINK